MLVSDYLRMRGEISVSTGSPHIQETDTAKSPLPLNEQGQTFAEALSESLLQKDGVQFSGHALKRITSRSIDVTQNDKLERLNKGVEIAAEKGSEETLILVDEAAFIVSVKNNKVITTLSKEDMLGNIFTNIDSTVII